MSENIVLDTPINARPGASQFRIERFTVDVREQSIHIRAAEWDGSTFVQGGTAVVHSESGQDTWEAIKALNKVDLSTKSLQTRLLERMQEKGTLAAGTISGDPE